MKKILMLIILFSVFIVTLKAQAMSLTTGNQWCYYWQNGPNSGYYTNIAIGDTLINGTVYQQLGGGFYRSNATQVHVKNTVNSPEYLLYDLNWELDEQVNINGTIYTVTDKGTMNYLGHNGRQFITLYTGNEYDWTERKYIEILGNIETEHWDFMSEFGYSRELIGVQIDGVIFGSILNSDDILKEPKTILYQNFPNPFNPTTTIKFSLPEDSKVELTIYNIKGQQIKTLTNSELTKGSHSVNWNGDDRFGQNVGSGFYFYRLNINGIAVAAKKCLLLK